MKQGFFDLQYPFKLVTQGHMWGESASPHFGNLLLYSPNHTVLKSAAKSLTTVCHV